MLLRILTLQSSSIVTLVGQSATSCIEFHTLEPKFFLGLHSNFSRFFNRTETTAYSRAWVENLKQRVPITSKSSKFKGVTQHYVLKLPKSAGARHYCPKIPWVTGTLGTCANSSLVCIEYFLRISCTTEVIWSHCVFQTNSKSAK